jgi:hypothetical protein
MSPAPWGILCQNEGGLFVNINEEVRKHATRKFPLYIYIFLVQAICVYCITTQECLLHILFLLFATDLILDNPLPPPATGSILSTTKLPT